MVYREYGFLCLKNARDLLFRRLLWWCFLLGVASSVTAEVKLKGVSVEPGSVGSWTVSRVRLENNESETKKIEIRLTLGSLENSVYEQRVTIEIPHQSVRLIWVPIWIPEDILNGTVTPNKNSKQRSFFNLLVQLYDNGALKSRETALGTIDDDHLMRGMNYGRDNEKNENYDPLAQYSPKEAAVIPEMLGWGKNRWVFKHRSDEIQGYSHLYADLYEKKSVIWVKKGFDQTHGLWSLLNWVERGGLLMIDPMAKEELGNLAAILGIDVGAATWNSLKKDSWKLDGSLVLRGQQHFTTKDWNAVMAERGVQLASERKWGLGKIVLLNYEWNGLIGKDRDKAKEILDSLLPQSLANEFEANNWKKSRENDLVMKHGNKIWSRESVMAFLGSLMLFSMVIWFLPYFNERRELRWGIWFVAMLGWTGVGLGMYLSKTSSGSQFSSEMISLSKSGAYSEKRKGFSVFYSESLRKFPVDFYNGMDCFKKSNNKSTVMSREINSIRYQDFSLQPMRVNLFEWNQSISRVQPEIQFNWSDRLELSMPKDIVGKEMVLVVGRRIWIFKGESKVSLTLESGKKLHQSEKASELEKTAYYLSTEANSKRSSLGTQRYWLIWEEIAEAPFSFPGDIKKSEKLTRVLEIEPTFERGPIQFKAGMAEWYFKRGKGVKSWKTSDLAFDGLDFMTESVNMSLGWSFTLPKDIQSRVEVEQLSLSLQSLPETMKENSLYVNIKGKRQKLTIANGRAILPKDALQDGNIEIEVQPPMPSIGTGSMMRSPWKPWIEGLELKGKLN